MAELQESLGIEDNFAQVLGLLDLDETQLMTVQGNEKPDFPCFRPNQGRKELKKSQPLSSEVTDGDILSNDTNKKVILITIFLFFSSFE